jgi:hypothetical protein
MAFDIRDGVESTSVHENSEVFFDNLPFDVLIENDETPKWIENDETPKNPTTPKGRILSQPLDNNSRTSRACRCTKHIQICSVCFLLVIVGVVVLIWFWKDEIFKAEQDENNKEDYDEGGIGRPGVDDVYRWNSFGQTGLTLSVMNALEERWSPFFYEAIHDWEKSDALILDTFMVPRDENCEGVNFAVTVCNGDYGDTDWRGITVLLLFEEHIINASIRLNDFHLDSLGNTWRRYVMCHELGHAWGLTHTDENHYNNNLGDCLDYSSQPAKSPTNLYPGKFNFDLLAQVYGIVNPIRLRLLSGPQLQEDEKTSLVQEKARRPELPLDILDAYKSALVAFDTGSFEDVAAKIAYLKINVVSSGDRRSMDLGKGFSILYYDGI